MSKIQEIRGASFKRQNGRCYYCNQPMWQTDLAAFAQRYGLTKAQAMRHRVTAEHLVARSHAGKDDEANIVAACAFCNSHRHRTVRPLDPDAHRQKVRKRLVARKWHGLHVVACNR